MDVDSCRLAPKFPLMPSVVRENPEGRLQKCACATLHVHKAIPPVHFMPQKFPVPLFWLYRKELSTEGRQD